MNNKAMVCFLDSNEMIQFRTQHPEGWIRLRTPEGCIEPLWGFSNTEQFLGFASGERPLHLTPTTVSIPHGTTFSVHDTLVVRPNGQVCLQSPTDELPILIQDSTELHYGTHGRFSSNVYTFQPTDALHLASKHLTLSGAQCDLRAETTFYSNVSFQAPLTAPLVQVGTEVRAPKVVADTLDAQTARVGSLLTPEGHIQQTLTVAASNASVCIGTRGGTQEATLTLHGALQLPAGNATHTIQGSLELHGALHTRTVPALFHKGAEIHQSCIIGQPHRPADMIVYGATHLSKPFYSHECAYFDKTVRLHGALQFAPGAVESRTSVAVAIPKGSMHLQEGHLWIHAATPVPDYTLYNRGNTYLDGTAWITKDLRAGSGSYDHGLRVGVGGIQVADGGLAVAAGGIKVAAGGLVVGTGGVKVADGGLVVAAGGVQVANGGLAVAAGGVQVADGGLSVSTGGLSVGAGGLSVAAGGVKVADGGLSVGAGGLSVAAGGVKVAAGGLTVADWELESQSLRVQQGNLGFKDGVLTHRHRRYGLYEPIAKRSRWFKWGVIPYRMGRTRFYVKLQGRVFSPTHSKTFTVSFGGTTASPNVKQVSVVGTLGTLDAAVQLWIYQDIGTQDFHGYIEVSPRIEAGFELDIEVGADTDVFTWDATPPNLSQSNWGVWWKPLETPGLQMDAGTQVFMEKVGIGEKKPLYALDVRADARFQSKLYQPFPADLIAAMGLTSVAQGDCVALTDILSWIIKNISKS